jgi:hypothetical protein
MIPPHTKAISKHSALSGEAASTGEGAVRFSASIFRKWTPYRVDRAFEWRYNKSTVYKGLHRVTV